MYKQAILQLSPSLSFLTLRDIVLEPYFMLYGEVYADKIDRKNPHLDLHLDLHFDLHQLVMVLILNFVLFYLLWFQF